MIQDGMQNGAKELTLKNELFNCSSFDNFETANGLVTWKWVGKWSHILIWSPSWPCMQKRDNFNWQFSLEKCNFWNVTKHRQYIYIYHFEKKFSTIKNLRLLPLKSPPFGLDRALNVWITWKMRNFSETFNGWSWYGWKAELKRNWIEVESWRSNG